MRSRFPSVISCALGQSMAFRIHSTDTCSEKEDVHFLLGFLMPISLIMFPASEDYLLDT